MTRHYLDHASTSPPRPEVVSAMVSWLEGAGPPPADPGRVHAEGRAARFALEQAREQVAAFLGTRPRQVVFTSGATESVNAAVWAATHAHPGLPVASAGVEHSSVRQASERLAPVVTLPVDGLGRILPDAVEAALGHAGAAETPFALVHCQAANHEVGTIQPVEEIVAICRSHGVLVHVDAASAVGHMELDLDQLGADLVSVSAHKFGGPPGIGALVVRRGLRFSPLIVGGDQERARRAGLENLPAAIGFGAAAETLCEAGRMATESQLARRLTDKMIAAATKCDGVNARRPRWEDPAHRGARDPGGRGRACPTGTRPRRHRRALGIIVRIRVSRAVSGARGNGGRRRPVPAVVGRLVLDRRGRRGIRSRLRAGRRRAEVVADLTPQPLATYPRATYPRATYPLRAMAGSGVLVFEKAVRISGRNGPISLTVGLSARNWLY